MHNYNKLKSKREKNTFISNAFFPRETECKRLWLGKDHWSIVIWQSIAKVKCNLFLPKIVFLLRIVWAKSPWSFRTRGVFLMGIADWRGSSSSAFLFMHGTIFLLNFSALSSKILPITPCFFGDLLSNQYKKCVVHFKWRFDWI